jgi:HTH-type transcriptional regulator/antitoxin HipB
MYIDLEEFAMDQIARTSAQIGAAVRRRRRQMTISQEELGNRIRLRQATISKLEAGEPGTRIKTLLDALGALGLEIVIRPRTTATSREIEEIF